MIICSLPRCGATKYCLDLQEKTGVEFVGELHPIHIGDTRKQTQHETHFQPNYSMENFVDILQNLDKYIVLLNQNSFLLLPQCHSIIIRKNMKNAYRSFANFLIKMYPKMKGSMIIHHLKIMRYDEIVIKAYIEKYSPKVILYEEYYGDLKTNTPLLDSHICHNIIQKEIESYSEKV